MSSPQTTPGAEKLRLKVVAGNALGMVIEVGEELVLGRLADGEGTLAADIEISRHHARIASEPDGRYMIEDLGSTNGTWVNGRRLDSPIALEAGDRVEVGASALVVQVSTPQPTPTTSDTIVPSSTEQEAPETAVVADPTPAAPSAPAPFVLRIEMDLAEGRATVALDESSDRVTLVHEDGRWRLA